ncbi:MAG: TetR/AcrR family transcriptional regulator C-terminal domain-containing protein [Pseudomonadota bacterium]
MSTSPPKRKQRRGLSRAQIVKAAVEYADQEGVEDLSMRHLAGTLGCGVMSLYNHIADKDDLLAAMVDAVAEEIEHPPPRPGGEGWRDDLKFCVTSAYKAMLNHPWVAGHWGRGNGPAKNAYHETVLRIMRQAGLSEELSCRGFHGLTMHVVGFALQVMELRATMTDKQKVHALGHQALSTLSEDEFPYLREHVRLHLAGKDQRNDFKYMRDLILDGLVRDHAAES